jgi:Protein of unknown function (DUF742)
VIGPDADDKPPAGQEGAGYLVRPFVKSKYRDDVSGPRLQTTSLRPYLLTAGRARAVDSSIEIETQVSATETGRAALAQLQFEQRDIVELCRGPLSVAEIAARLDLHLGVVRVLVGDLTALGYLSVLRPNGNSSHDIDTISRVIRGLRALSS